MIHSPLFIFLWVMWVMWVRGGRRGRRGKEEGGGGGRGEGGVDSTLQSPFSERSTMYSGVLRSPASPRPPGALYYSISRYLSISADCSLLNFWSNLAKNRPIWTKIDSTPIRSS